MTSSSHVGEPMPGTTAEVPAVRFRHEIRPGEPLGPALSRIGDTELAVALEALESPDLAGGIHTARKAIKRTRAVLRMIRDQIPSGEFREQNVALRDAARRLSAARSAYVTARLAERITAESGVGPAAEPLCVRLEGRWETAATRLRAGPEIPAVQAAVATARSRVSDWDALRIPDDFSATAPGIRRVYRRGRSAMAAAHGSRTTASLHRWRKRVRYHRYQMECLHLMRPAVLDGLAAELATLAESLGEEHDLAELATALTEDGGAATDAVRDRLLSIVADARAVRWATAWEVGAGVYAEPPAILIARLGSYWDAWRQEAPAVL